MEMKLILEIHGKSYPVTVREDANRYQVDLPDRHYSIDVRRIEETDSLSLLVGNESVEAWTVPTKTGYDVSVLGGTFQVDVEDALRAGLRKLAGAAAGGGDEIVRAPMPGVVVEVKAELGQAVEAGETLIIVEAMKMRNEFAAKSGGIFSKVSVEPGQSVERGQEMCVISPSPVDEAEESEGSNGAG